MNAIFSIIRFLFLAIFVAIRATIMVAWTVGSTLVYIAVWFGWFFARFWFFIFQGFLVGTTYAAWKIVGTPVKPAMWKLVCIFTGTYDRRASKAEKINRMKNRVQTLTKPEKRHEQLGGRQGQVYNMIPGAPVANSVAARMKAIKQADHEAAGLTW